MKQKEIFEVAVRVIGLVMTIIAVMYFTSSIIVLINPAYRPNLSPAWHYCVAAMVWLPIGVYLLRGGSRIVKFAYPEDHKARATKTDA